MKKLLSIFAAISTIFCACNKIDPMDDLIEVSFGVTIDDTKSVDVNKHLSNLYPKYFMVDLIYLANGTVYKCRTGETIRIPRGNYKIISRSYNITESGEKRVWGGNGYNQKILSLSDAHRACDYLAVKLDNSQTMISKYPMYRDWEVTMFIDERSRIDISMVNVSICYAYSANAFKEMRIHGDVVANTPLSFGDDRIFFITPADDQSISINFKTISGSDCYFTLPHSGARTGTFYNLEPKTYEVCLSGWSWGVSGFDDGGAINN